MAPTARRTPPRIVRNLWEALETWSLGLNSVGRILVRRTCSATIVVRALEDRKMSLQRLVHDGCTERCLA